jgi:hypothetical protein
MSIPHLTIVAHNRLVSAWLLVILACLVASLWRFCRERDGSLYVAIGAFNLVALVIVATLIRPL